MPNPEFPAGSCPALRFACGHCGHELEAPLEFAGVEAPCPICGELVQAPEPAVPVQILPAVGNADDLVIRKPRPGHAESGGQPERQTHSEISTEVTRPLSQRVVTSGRENLEVLSDGRLRRQDSQATRKIVLEKWQIAGLALAVAASSLILFWKRGKGPAPSADRETPAAELVSAGNQKPESDQQASIEAARDCLARLIAAKDRKDVDRCLLPGGASAETLPFPLFPGRKAADFDFVQIRPIGGSERVLVLFELASSPPILVPVEETAAGMLVHGLALAQQWSGTFSKFLAGEGLDVGIFYTRIHLLPESEVIEMQAARPEFSAYILASVEPAFASDGPQKAVVCLKPESPEAKKLMKSANDPLATNSPSFVVRLARRAFSKGNRYVELVRFETNAWAQK